MNVVNTERLKILAEDLKLPKDPLHFLAYERDEKHPSPKIWVTSPTSVGMSAEEQAEMRAALSVHPADGSVGIWATPVWTPRQWDIFTTSYGLLVAYRKYCFAAREAEKAEKILTGLLEAR